MTRASRRADYLIAKYRWSVHWFRLEFNVPAGWVDRGADYFVELQWKSGCEVLVFSECGKVIQVIADHTAQRIHVSL